MPPVIIFLSDGDDDVSDEAIYDICRSAASQGRPLSFHAVFCGRSSLSSSSLRRMAQISLEVQKIAQVALEAQKNAPDNPLQPAAATVPSSYTVAPDTVGLTETFLGIAVSLGKPAGPLSSSH